MRAAGIIAEYNPLHNGHEYHIAQTRKTTGCDAVVVAMSGDFVQRGAPAVFDKWVRAEHALRSGADLVIEIPVLHCLGNAGQYASAGVSLMESLETVRHIVFGSESGDLELLRIAAEFLNAESAQLEEQIRALGRKGFSYPAARTKAFEMLGGSSEAVKLLERPNDILAVEYIRHMKSSAPVAIRRLGASYDQDVTDAEQYQSASGIRNIMKTDGDVFGYVPAHVDAAVRALGSADITERERRLFDLVRYAVIAASPEYIDDCPSGGEGLGNLLQSNIREAESLDDLISRVKSRRYTYTRISRLLMQILLGITRSAYCNDDSTDRTCPGYIRVLGFSDTGRALLSEIRHYELASLPVVTNINKERGLLSGSAVRSLELDLHAADIYNLIMGRSLAGHTDHRTRPVYPE